MHMGIEIALLLHDDFGAAGGQADQIKTEAGIKRIIEGIEPFAKQAVDDLPLRHRPPRVDHDRAHYAVGAEKARFQPPRPLALLLHGGDERCGQPRQGCRDHLIGRHRFGKALLHDVIRQRLAGTDRRIALPKHMFQQGREAGAEAGGDFMPAARGDIADGLQPGAAQTADNGFIGAERGYRQEADCIRFSAIADNATMDMIAKRSRTGGRAGNRGADSKALRRQHAAQKLQQRRLAAEQMGAAGDVEKQAMRRIERHQRRKAVAPVGDIVQ